MVGYEVGCTLDASAFAGSFASLFSLSFSFVRLSILRYWNIVANDALDETYESHIQFLLMFPCINLGSCYGVYRKVRRVYSMEKNPLYEFMNDMSATFNFLGAG
jgi:hypothetical protein